MTKEQMQRGNELLSEMNRLIAEKNLWESVYSMDDRISGFWLKDKSGTYRLSSEFVPMQILKTIVLDNYYKEISRLETEFNNL